MADTALEPYDIVGQRPLVISFGHSRGLTGLANSGGDTIFSYTVTADQAAKIVLCTHIWRLLGSFSLHFHSLLEM